ncbi:---NA--- [Octopus vulgaris]|uniref:---NA n=1 Tax=Octopus vulgaris TaxID=6645 RepID=A0AA36B5I9_OCTVU|nr:---NA--- [Octopus vulgaris]
MSVDAERKRWVRSQISVPICGKSFSVRSHLTKCNLIHQKAKSYHCDISGKLFSRSSGPMRTKTYPYYVCGKSFSLNGSLTKHKHIPAEEEMCY